MKLEAKLYSESELLSFIKEAVAELETLVSSAGAGINGSKSTVVDQWSSELLPSIERAVAEEVYRRHPQGITFSVWSGPPSSGKGTNLRVLDIAARMYREYAVQGFAPRFEDKIHQRLLDQVMSAGTIITGSGGIFNANSGEYMELFSQVSSIVAAIFASGGFIGDSTVNPLVLLMVLLRLVQNHHRIQIDLWPRTMSQFDTYRHFVAVVRSKGGKVVEDFVNIRIVEQDILEKMNIHPKEYYIESLRLGSDISDFRANNSKYKKLLSFTKSEADYKKRFKEEKAVVSDLWVILRKSSKDNNVREDLIKEMENAIGRMEYRLNEALAKGAPTRVDGYPLSWIKRLEVYAKETSPAFLRAHWDTEDDIDIGLISTYYSPAEVAARMLDEVIGKSDDLRWIEFKKMVGQIAESVVKGDSPIESKLIETLRGIFLA